MNRHLELQIHMCPKGHVVPCFAGQHLRFSPRGFRRLTEAANRVVARLDALEAQRPAPTKMLH